ncbi:MAG: calcium-binding EGF-like domain-containing protein [Kofleriaceae bacterium]|nr:calcium-binding EGF-like domain-containing protein [Kofleriaceae bacterium]
MHAEPTPSTNALTSSLRLGALKLLLSALTLTTVACGGVADDAGGADTTPDASMDPTPDSGPPACPTGYTGATCTDCDAGYQDVDGDDVCLPSCEATGSLALACGAHGTCAVDDAGERACMCEEGHTGAACDQCAPGYVMSADACELYTPSATDLVLWLDSTAGTLTQVGSTAVASWRDRRGGVSSLQATASGTARPTRVTDGLNGRTVLRFDGDDDLVISNFPGLKTADYTVIVVYKPTGAAADNLVSLRQSEIGVAFGLRRTSSTGYRYSHRGTPAAGNGDFADLAFGAADASNVKLIAMRRFTSGTLDYMLFTGNEPGDLDGVTGSDTALVEPALSNSMTLHVGDAGMIGDLAEVLIYDRAVPDQELATLRTYLAAKWGIE